MGAGETILLAEDDEGLRTTRCVQLRRQGYHVIVAEDGSQALERFFDSERPVDLTLLDVILPKKGGVSVAEELRKRNLLLPILFVTGYETGDATRWVRLHERTRLLRKPTPFVILHRVLRELLHEVAHRATAFGS